MRIFRYLCCFLCVVFLFCCLFTVCSAESDNKASVLSGCHSVDATSTYLGSGQILENVQSAFVYETNSDTLMYTYNPDLQVYPSSLAKILTALIAVEQGNPEDIIIISENTLATIPYDAVSAELQPGEEISLNDLLYCMMTGSANDAAAVIAEHIFGTQDAFVQKMNDYAQSLGCVATQFQNVHGLHHDQQYTTVRDLARILSVAVKNEQFCTYFSAIHYTVPATNKSEARELSSSNFLMNTDNMEIYFDARVTGGRTGVSEDGRRCMAASAENNGMQLITIVTGTESTFAEDGRTLTYGGFKETISLLDAAFNGYKVSQVLYNGQTLRQVAVADGSNDVILGSNSDVVTVLPEDATLRDLTFKYTDTYEQLQAPVREGQKLSNVQIWYGGLCVGETDLYAMNAVGSVLHADTNDAQDGTAALPMVVAVFLWGLLGVAVIIIAFVLIRRLRSIVARNKNRRYRRDRRRSR